MHRVAGEACGAADALEGFLGGKNLGLARGGMGIIEQYLARKVAEFHDVPVGQDQFAHPSAHHGLGQDSAQGTGTHQQNLSGGEALLAFLSQGGKALLPIKSLWLVGGHERRNQIRPTTAIKIPSRASCSLRSLGGV